MTEQISIEVSEHHAGMYRDIAETVGDDNPELRETFEDVIHRTYQNLERAQGEQSQQQMVMETPEDRET